MSNLEKVDPEIFEAIKVMPYEMGPGIIKGGSFDIIKDGHNKRRPINFNTSEGEIIIYQ